MILQALNSYYERLQSDPDSDVAPIGFSRQKITFCVVINADGTFDENSIEDLRTQVGSKLLPQSLVVLGNAKPPGAGINPCFLWDNPAYMLGYKSDDPKPERTQQSFEAFRQRHLDAEAAISTPEFSAVCRFLESWNPKDAANYQALADVSTGFGVFRIRGSRQYVHEVPTIRKWWLNEQEQSTTTGDRVIGQCLVTGEVRPLARLHDPKVKGVSGGQSAGAAIVSFNLDAFESYGKSQSINAPVSEQAAFQYCTALNGLLADSNRRIQIGDATTVFWTEKSTFAENLFAFALGNNPPEDQALASELRIALSAIAQGTYIPDPGERDTPFYLLGLSPNAARVSVRFWMVSTLGKFVEHLGVHYENLEMFDPADIQRAPVHADELERQTFLRETHPLRNSRLSNIRQLLDETVTAKNGMADRDRVSPQLAGGLLRSIFEGRRYPTVLLQKVLQRIQTDGFVDPEKRRDWRQARHRRAAVLRACVNRELRGNQFERQECFVDSYLNKRHPDAAYQSGRVMAVLSFVQELAIKKVNSTIVRRYLSAVSASPGLHLGRLQVQAEVGHLPKLPQRTASFLRDELKSINAGIKDSIPRHLDHLGQSLFVLGFYHELTHLEANRISIAHCVRTMRGEWVRSSGEKMLADALAKLTVEYCYEPQVILHTGVNRIPDFMIPADEEANNCFIEYLGLDKPEYNSRWSEKLNAYHASGITVEGGARGRLYIIDARVDKWDEPKLISQLKKWFDVNLPE